MRGTKWFAMFVALTLPATASADGACSGDDFEKQCTKFHNETLEICDQSKIGNDENAVEAWAKRATRLSALLGEEKAFKAKYGACYVGADGCSLHDDEIDECVESVDKYKKEWKEMMDWTLSTTLGQSFDRVTELKKEKSAMNYGAAVDDLKRAIATTEGILKVNDLALIHADGKALEAKLAEARKAVGQTEGQLKEVIASVRCPRSVYSDASLLAQMKKIAVDARNESTKTMGLKVSTLTFVFISKPWQEALPFHVTNEYVATGACEKQVKEEGGDTHCYTMEMKYKRSKTGGGKFSPWSLDAVGGGKEVLCENVNK